MQKVWKRLLLGVAGIGVAVLGFGYVWLWLHGFYPAPPGNAQDQCGTCHSMQEEVLAWESSPHKEIACLQCHLEGDPEWIRTQFAANREKMTGNAADAMPHPLQAAVDEQRCISCHQPQMDSILKDVTPAPLPGATANPNQGKPMPTRAEHKLHVEKGDLACMDCHTSAAHGPKDGTALYKNQTHDLCLDCHLSKPVAMQVKGDIACAACHTDLGAVTPQDHKNETAWRQEHGKASATQTCGACHLSESAGPHTRIADPRTITPSVKDACMSCHGGVEQPHPNDWLQKHDVVYQTSGDACVTCHGTDQNGTKVAVGQLTNTGICAQCHQVPMPHGSGYLADHGSQALSPAGDACANCHSPSSPIQPTPDHARQGFCADCHAVGMPHPDSFESEHGQLALEQPAVCEACHSAANPARPYADHASPQFCAACHGDYQHPDGWVADHGSRVTNACYTCHTAKGPEGANSHTACSSCHTSDGSWHPEMWYVTHANVVEQNGKADCMVCHAEVEPSCTKCHRNP